MWAVVNYELLQAPYAESLIDELHALAIIALGSIDRAELAWRLRELPRSTVLVARATELVGFKIGYAVGSDRYYSWLGAVHPGWRRQSIALALLERQHGWLREQGFKTVETAANPSNVAMLSLNFRGGFRIVGNYWREDDLRVLLAKKLSG